MNRFTRAGSAIASSLSLLLTVACGDEPTDTPDDTSTVDDTSTAADTGDTGILVETVHLMGQVFQLGAPAQPASQIEVCFVAEGDPDRCTTTAADGTYDLAEVPSDTVGAVRYAGDGIATFYWMLATEGDDLTLTLSVDTPEIVQGYYDQTGLTAAPGSAVVLAEIFPDVQADWMATLTPSGGSGPFYYTTFTGGLDLAATATFANIAMAVFLNVDRDGGPYQTAFTQGATGCEASSFGAPTVPPWRIPADADVVYRSFACP